MTDKIFINAVKTLIANYFNNNVDVTDGKKITTDDVYIVWSCKTLQNFKAFGVNNCIGRNVLRNYI